MNLNGVKKENVSKWVKIIKNLTEGDQAIKDLLQYKIVAFHSEFIEPLQRIPLLGIGLPRIVYLFDIQQCPNLIQKVSNNILQNSSITKIVHGGAAEIRRMNTILHINLTNLFDTQIAFRETKRNIITDFNQLCYLYNIQGNTVRDEINAEINLNGVFWSKRPLNNKMLESAGSEVFFLFHLYRQLSRHITNPDHFRGLCENPNYEPAKSPSSPSSAFASTSRPREQPESEEMMGNDNEIERALSVLSLTPQTNSSSGSPAKSKKKNKNKNKNPSQSQLQPSFSSGSSAPVYSAVPFSYANVDKNTKKPLSQQNQAYDRKSQFVPVSQSSILQSIISPQNNYLKISYPAEGQGQTINLIEPVVPEEFDPWAPTPELMEVKPVKQAPPPQPTPPPKINNSPISPAKTIQPAPALPKNPIVNSPAKQIKIPVAPFSNTTVTAAVQQVQPQKPFPPAKSKEPETRTHIEKYFDNIIQSTPTPTVQALGATGGNGPKQGMESKKPPRAKVEKAILDRLSNIAFSPDEISMLNDNQEKKYDFGKLIRKKICLLESLLGDEEKKEEEEIESERDIKAGSSNLNKCLSMSGHELLSMIKKEKIEIENKGGSTIKVEEEEAIGGDIKKGAKRVPGRGAQTLSTGDIIFFNVYPG